MTLRQTRRIATIALCAALVAPLAGCGAGLGRDSADKAGGSTSPVVLRLGASDNITIAESRNVQYFAAQVKKLSGGTLRVQLVFQAAGDNYPDVESRTARRVRGGDFDLGWIGSRAWDELGVHSFQALQAPFLITDYALLDKVAMSPLAGEMLAGLERQGVVGLALVPGLLRHPVGFKHAFASPSDFATAQVRDVPSHLTDSILAALGATPVHVGNAAFGRSVAAGRIDGTEASLANSVGGIVTANVSFFPKVSTLFAGRRSFERLSNDQRKALRVAAQRTLEHVASRPADAGLSFEGVLARQYCEQPSARVALANVRQLASLERAEGPVYAELAREPQTGALIQRIRKLKASLPPAPPLALPRSCLHDSQSAPADDGRRTRDHIGRHLPLGVDRGCRKGLRPGGDEPGNSYPAVFTAVLRDGRWLFRDQQPPETGTYTVGGRRVSFVVGGGVLTFTYRRGADGTLRLEPVLPMDRGDQWVWSGAPWRRIGPPAGNIP